MPKRSTFYLSESVEAKLEMLSADLRKSPTEVVERAISLLFSTNGGEPGHSGEMVSVTEEELQRLIESI